LCNGQLLPISQNTALFSLLGTNFGGNGISTFALPNLQGSMPIGYGQGPGLPQYIIGETGGEQNVTLLTSQMPSHTHQHQGTTAIQATEVPTGATFGESGRSHPSVYYVAAPTPSTSAPMSPTELGIVGGSQAHPNMMPYLVMTYVIALQGQFPPRS
jgi:microcystin-dependent protein